MTTGLILALMALVFLTVAGCVLFLFVHVFRRIRSGAVVPRSPRSGSRHDPYHGDTSDRMSSGSDYTGGL